jgi:hypothetical protein
MLTLVSVFEIETLRLIGPLVHQYPHPADSDLHKTYKDLNGRLDRLDALYLWPECLKTLLERLRPKRMHVRGTLVRRLQGPSFFSSVLRTDRMWR